MASIMSEIINTKVEGYMEAFMNWSCCGASHCLHYVDEDSDHTQTIEMLRKVI